MKQKSKRPAQNSSAFNEWAQKMNVSSMWFEDTPEKRNMMERIRNAKFAEAMGWDKPQVKPKTPHYVI